jgi:predicted transcriptional regulator
MHDPQRDPFYEGLRADILEGAADADRGDLVDLEEVIRELHDENASIAEI